MKDTKMYLKKYTIQIWCENSEESSSLEFATDESHEGTNEIFEVAERIHQEEREGYHFFCSADRWKEGWESEMNQ